MGSLYIQDSTRDFFSHGVVFYHY
uniref:Uncharacterized protein n=1 Tax=Anguilla anguilla TaxID=7936 RepID=A0A0E9UV42_ANGAN